MNPLLANVYSLGNLTQNFYLADFFDVAIVALLIYSAILLFKQTRSTPAIIGIGILIVLYGIARLFNLYLTSLALQTFFGVFLVVLVVIFQNELRRFFEFIAMVSTRKRAQQAENLTSMPMQELVRAMASLAHKKIGALVVLVGHQNIDRLIEGGKALDGLISEEFLESIFDPSTSGHDGALIIEKNRISQFSAHLPLSTNFKEIGKHGTRHGAALGISEQSDTLVIVVSEERGTISIARNGTLKALKNAAELEEHIYNFLKEKFPEETYKTWETLLKKNLLEKIAAIACALLLWFFIAFPAGTVQRDIVVPITYKNVPENLVVEDTSQKEITVTFSARGELAFEQFEQKDFEIAINGNTLKPGANSIKIEERMMARPINFSVVKAVPAALQLNVKQYNEFEIPIKIITKGRVARSVKFVSAAPNPSSIKILIRDGTEPPASINTEPINIENLSETKMFEANIVFPQNTRIPKLQKSSISVLIEVQQK